MSQVWSEINKVVNVLDIAAAGHSTSSGATIDTDIVHLENYKKLTYLITLGSTAAANIPTVNVFAGETASTATTAIAFKYRTQITEIGGTTGTSGSDVSSTMNDSTGDGFQFTTGSTGGVNGGMYIVEVDPSVVAACTSTGDSFDHVKLRFTNSSAGAAAAQHYSCLAVLSEPRYPQAILQTAID